MFERMREDISAVFANDPAARSTWEVLFCYPGLHAIWLHRIAHSLWLHKFFFAGRFVSHLGRWLTGVEIHPGAQLGKRVFIDHGMGIVIGETAEVGEEVLIYQGVVLGGTSLEKKKRHPTIGNRVVIGAGAKILGPITVGDNARVGAGSVVVKPVPAGATVVGVPAHIAGPKDGSESGSDLQHGRLPDPVLRALSEILDRQNLLEERIDGLERLSALSAAPEERPALPTCCEADIREALKEVIDPEVGINVVDLGLIKDVALNGRRVKVNMVLTSSLCPLAGYLVEQVRRKVSDLVGDKPVEVTILDEPWNWERFADEGN